MNPSTHLDPSPGWCLRFLSGAVRGRTIALNPGTNVVGSAADCQVLLPASDVQPRHLIFSVGAVALSMQRVATAEARLNGDDMQAARRSLVAGDLISVGKIDFQIERSYAAASESPTKRPADFAETMFLDAGALRAANAAAGRPVATKARNRTQAWMMGGAVWMLTMGMVWWAVSGTPSQVRQDGEQLNLAALETALKEFPEAEVLAGPAGQVSVKGFVESRARKQVLQREMQTFGSRVSVNVHSVDDLLDQARRFVSDPGVAVAYVGRGRLVVSGKSESLELQEKIHRLGEDLHPAVLVSDKVQYPAVPLAKAPEQRDAWSDWQRSLPSRMVSITQDSGGLRYIQLADGSLYFEGSPLKSGAELKRVSPNTQVVTAKGSP